MQRNETMSSPEVAVVQNALSALFTVAPAAAQRATGALDYLLKNLVDSAWSEVAWSASRLTWDGFPLLFTCTSTEAAVRYTVEVAGPEVDYHRRLDCALEALGALGAYRGDDPLIARITAIQRCGALRYGAWIGGRHNSIADRYKLYAEVPKNDQVLAEQWAVELLGDEPLLHSRRPVLVMIGYVPHSARVELYFRGDGLEDWEIGRLMRRAGLAGYETILLNLLEQAYGRPIARGLPHNMFWSFSIALDGAAPVFSLFCFARSLFGSDASVRRRLLALAEQRGMDLEMYARLSEPLAQRKRGKSSHGMLALVAQPADAPVLHIDVRPPI